MSKPYLLVSDLHFNNWSAFSKTNEDGVNSRLQIQIDEIKRAVGELKAKGGNTMFNCGDTFHIRGSVQTTVLNPVMDLFDWIAEQEVVVYSLPGNHDLYGKESDEIGNAARAIKSYMAHGIKVVVHDGEKIIMFPWQSNLDQLRKNLERLAKPDRTAMIHAPVDGVITGLPGHGLSAEWLASLGYKNVFAGHYHNARSFPDSIYSVGSPYHQTWSDVDSSAGFWLIYPDRAIHNKTKAPRFVEVFVDQTLEELKAASEGNYVRIKLDATKDSDVAAVREELESYGALGVIVLQNKSTVSLRGSESKKLYGINDLIKNYVEKVSPDFSEALEKECLDILSEASELK